MDEAPPEADEKRFHGWRLLGVIAIVIALIGSASLLIHWIVVV